MNLYNDIPEVMKGKTLMITGGTGSFASASCNPPFVKSKNVVFSSFFELSDRILTIYF